MSRAQKEARRARKKEKIRAARPALWEECREKFSLTDEDIRKAKELGMLPEKMILQPVNPKEHWKMPQRSWIRYSYNRYEAKLEKRRKTADAQ